MSSNDYDELRDTLSKITEKAKTGVPQERTRLKPETLELIKERKRLIQQGKNVRHLSKQLRKKVEADYKEFNNQKAIEAAEKMTSIKQVNMKNSLSREANIGMKDQDGNLQRSKSL